MQTPSSTCSPEQRVSSSRVGKIDATWGAILCDLDGCLVSGGRLLKSVEEFFHQHQQHLWVVSNNSSDTPEILANKLQRLGLPIKAERLLLAGVEALIAIAARRPGGRLALFASDALHAHGEALGLCLTQERPEVVLLCRDTRFDYDALSRILIHLESGAELVVANPDASHPSISGPPVPETGALLAAIRTVLPHQALQIFGKPERFLFEAALARAGVSPADALMIGDNTATDGAGARALGITYAEVTANAGLSELMGVMPCSPS